MAKIIGNTTTTPMARPDWNQTDETKADYIKNKPEILTETDVQELIAEAGVIGEPGADGQDGLTPEIKDGIWWIGDQNTGVTAEGKDAVAPQIRINATTNMWEISTDGGNTFVTTDVKATGEKGNTGTVVIDEDVVVHDAVGTTFPPTQLSADSRFDDSDICVDLYVENSEVLPTDGATSDDIHAYIDEVANMHPEYITKETLGKDASQNFDIVRYTFCNREYCAWVKENYPKMYAWKNDSVIMYTESVSPRIGEKAYDEPFILTKKITIVNVTKPRFTNLKDDCIFRYNKRYSMSSGAWKDTTALENVTSIIVPVPSGKTDVTVHFKGVTPNADYTAVYAGTSADVFAGSNCLTDEFSDVNYPADENGVRTLPCTKSEESTYIVFNLLGTQESDFVDMIVTVDEPIEYETITEEVEEDVESGTPITDVSATNRSRTINNLEYIRYESGDIEPTIIYTDVDDERNSSTTITKGGITYHRYPLGDLLANKIKPIPIFVYANEHGTCNQDAISTGRNETKLCALVASRMIRDLGLNKQSKNPLYKYIRENCMLIIIPVVNVYGFNHYMTDVTKHNYDSYNNFNVVNINRNYDTPGWDHPNMNWNKGAYPGSENETQYVMNTMVESGAVVAMSLHGVGGMLGTCRHQGQNPGCVDYNQDKLAKVNDIIYKNYGLQLLYYDYDYDKGEPIRCANTPDVTSKSPSFITQCGAYGGIVEFQPVKAGGVMGEQYLDSNVVECAYVQMLNLMAMWLSDYLDNNKENGLLGGDYILTDADKAELVQMVLDSLSNGDEVSY